MKFGETGDPIHSLSFFVQEGYSTPPWPFDRTVKVLKAIDGSIIDTINFGAREHRSAEFNLNYMSRADHYTLKTYFDANRGLRIRVELENSGERVFGEQYTGTVYYAYLLETKSLGETQFSAGHTMYGYAMKMELAGTTATSVPNAADTSQYDFLIKMDCVRATVGCQVTNKAALDAITTKPGGSRGLTTVDRKVYFYNAANSTWEYQYTAPANDPSQGLNYGVFYLSAFSDISGSSSGISATLGSAQDFKSGWLVEKSIKFPRYSVDARQGPAIEHPEGFSFAVENSAKRWKFPLDNNLAFYGAYCELYVYDRLNGQMVLLRSGYNNRNTFDYTKLEFEVEPGIFLQNKSFPTTVVGKDNFPNAADAMRGKPVLTTYGRWDRGLVQTEAFNLDPVRFPIGKKMLQVISWNSGTLQMVLDLDPAQVTKVLGYAFTSYPAATSIFLFAAIYAQPGQSDLKKLRKVTAVADASGKLQLTLDAGFADPVTTSALVVIYLSNIQILVDDDAVIGMRAAGFLIKGSSPTATLPLEFYGKEGDVIKAIPDRMFKVIGDTKENQITVDTASISLEDSGEMTASDTVPMSILPPDFMHETIDKTHALGYKYFDFGFSPKGVSSNEVLATPIAKNTNWTETAKPGGVSGFSYHQVVTILTVPSQGKAFAAFSKNFTTLIWTPFTGSTGYKISRYILGVPLTRVGSSLPRLDATFGGGAGIELKNGTGPTSVSGGVVTLAGSTAGVNDGAAFMLIDKSVDNTLSFEYFYTVEPIVNGQSGSTIQSNSGLNRSVKDGVSVLYVVARDGTAGLCWPAPDNQQGVTVSVNGTSLGGMPISSATQGWFEVTGLTNNQEYKFQVSINCLSIGDGDDVWFELPNIYTSQGIHQLLKSGAPYSSRPYGTMLDSKNCDLDNPADMGWARSWGVVTSKFVNDGLDLPAAAVVFSWVWKVDQAKIGDMTGAKEARILGDFVVKSWVGDNTSAHCVPIPVTVQLRGIKADKSTAFTIQYSDMTVKAPVESGSWGAYAQFKNLHGAKNGLGANTNYDTDNSAPNADATYTGKDLWKLPDYLFEDGAAEWSKVEYLMFSVTNAAAIPWSVLYQSFFGAVINGFPYHLGIGGPPKQSWAMVRDHKPDLFLEYIRKFDGGLREPLYARIDGGVKDDAAGSITGTPGKIIEKARHVIDHVVTSLVGFKPICLGNEMKSRDGWLWRWQTKDSKPLLDTLQTLAENIHGIFTIAPNGGLYLRSLDIDDPNIPSVYSFTDSNIIVDSLGKPEYRRRNEIYQKFRLKYNIEPSKGGATEEMLIGWDLASSKPIYSGYPRTAEDANGIVADVDGLDGLPDLCKLSIQLNAAGVGANEFGTDVDNEKVYEMFYRPTKPSNLTGLPVERDLPNLFDQWGLGAMPPKMAMQALTRMVVKYFCFDSWYFPLSCSMKSVVFDSAVTGVKDEAGTADHKLKLGDVVTVTSAFHTNGQPIRAIILDMDLQGLYDGQATLHVFAPRPPGQFGIFVDPVWDAGAPGARNEANYLFKGSLYGLLSEDGTFADAGGTGARNEANMKFPDGTYADPKGSGSGKA